MLQYISASFIYPVSGAPMENGVIGLEEDGTIREVLTSAEAEEKGIKEIQYYKGILVPGLVNTHCHLELSHLFGKIPEQTGLQGFVQQVIQHRGMAEELVQEAMIKADLEMFNSGIVAVGDISNQLISKEVKLNSRLYYHTFIEMLGFNPENAEAVMAKGLELKENFLPLKSSVVPHAPYSVSRELFGEIRKYSGLYENLISMHNQETEEENLFFQQKTGAFLKLYEFLGLDISFFQAPGRTSLQSIVQDLPKQKALLVHNTQTDLEDIIYAEGVNSELYWCLCPNANLYIENRLPDVEMIHKAGVRITLGTDSLASNHQLSILAEMKALQEIRGVDFIDLLTWATLNGAEFLGIDGTFGSISKGKKPGINLIEQMDKGRITKATTIKRII